MTAGHLVFLPAKRRLVCVDCFRRLTGLYPLPSLRCGAGLLELRAGGYMLPPRPAVPKGADLSGCGVVQYPYRSGSAPQQTHLYTPGVIQYLYSAPQRTHLYTPGVVQYPYPYRPGSAPQPDLWNPLVLSGIVAAAIAIPIGTDDDDEA